MRAQLDSQAAQNENQVRELEAEIVNVERLLVQVSGDLELKSEQLLELERSRENQNDSLLALRIIVAQVQDEQVGDALTGSNDSNP